MNDTRDTSASPTTDDVASEHQSDFIVSTTNGSSTQVGSTLDIEHAAVTDDPRQWSRSRKNVVLAVISIAAMIGTLGANIYNPAINQIQKELHASDQEIALSLSLYILVQGNIPLLWSAISEIKGRKLVYIIGLSLFIVGCGIVASAKSTAVVIAMRCLQAIGCSPVIAIGAATLADIYDPDERGTMMGIYYATPLLGPAIGPIIGGVLSQLFNWRATFWFLVIFGGLVLLALLPLKDTFRQERSLAYQAALKRALKQRSNSPDPIQVRAADEKASLPPSESELEKNPASGKVVVKDEIQLSFRDINPFPALKMILIRKNNLVTLIASGVMFSFGYSISYTTSRTLANKYHYNPLDIGFVLLSYGIGCTAGSVLGGRWSDRVLSRLKAENGGQSYPEMRLQCTKYAMPFLPLVTVAFAWLLQKQVHISAICIMLFFCGFFTIWVYSSTLVYIVDANAGRSSSAVATNSSFRGMAGFIAAEIGAPLQDSIGDGGLYTLWAGFMVIMELLILLVIWKGPQWRKEAEERENERR